jgi:hypothetical protein
MDLAVSFHLSNPSQRSSYLQCLASDDFFIIFVLPGAKLVFLLTRVQLDH